LFRVYKNYKHIYAPNIKTSKYGNTSSPEQWFNLVESKFLVFVKLNNNLK
jgi:hypothetical protein